jgi:sugar phosphate isomerase/epimerase
MAKNPQNCEKRAAKVLAAMKKTFKASGPKLNLSWSNWGFGREPLRTSLARLQKAKIEYIELHGNRYTDDLGYKAKETAALLEDFGIRAAGICGMFGHENDLSSASAVSRQGAIDYIRRQLDLAQDLGCTYMLVVPGECGRVKPAPYEFERSVDTLRLVADEFVKAGVRAAIEPIRADEVSFCHSFDDALGYIAAVDRPGVQHINGDLYHMLHHEDDPALTILTSGKKMANLHMADTNRGALGSGFYDLDSIIAALYAVGYNNENCFCTCEPLGPGGDVYRAMHGLTPAAQLDELVISSARYWREREAQVRAAAK